MVIRWFTVCCDSWMLFFLNFILLLTLPLLPPSFTATNQLGSSDAGRTVHDKVPEVSLYVNLA
jgi:hypothetical protein